jgi:hypothetical protein
MKAVVMRAPVPIEERAAEALLQPLTAGKIRARAVPVV